MTTAPPPGNWVRLAAVVALGAALGCLAIVVAAVALELGDLLLASASVLVLVFSGWFVLTRRGLMRLLGVAGCVLGLAGLVGFVGEHWLALLVLVGAAALFGGAARYAVDHMRSTVSRAHPNVRPANPARRGVLIINPKSGGGNAERFNLPEEARKRRIQPVLLRPGTDLCDAARQAVEDGADVIGMAGGDGSQALVAAVAMEHDVAHVCVPAGTLNHFALDLGLDRDDVVGALDAFTDGVERRIDLASVNERIFVNNASLGVYGRVLQSDAYRDAKLRTWTQMLPELLGPRATSLDLQFEGPDASDWSDAALVVVSNNPYELRPRSGAGTRPRSIPVNWASWPRASAVHGTWRSSPRSVRSASRNGFVVYVVGRVPSSKSARALRLRSASTVRRWCSHHPCGSSRYQARCAFASRSTQPGCLPQQPQSH